NNGAVEVHGGSLNLTGGGTSGGAFTVDAAAELQLRGIHTLTTGSQVVGAGTVYIATSGTTTIGGADDLGVSGKTIVVGGPGVVDFSGTVNSVGGLLSVGLAGTVDFHDKDLSVARLALIDQASHLRAGNITVSDQFDWSLGALEGNVTVLDN